MRVYAGVDKVSRRRLNLTETVPAGPKAWGHAEEIRAQLVRQVEDGRHPTTDATVAQMLQRYLADRKGLDSFLDSLHSYAAAGSAQRFPARRPDPQPVSYRAGSRWVGTG